jgi:hypothetical protein
MMVATILSCLGLLATTISLFVYSLIALAVVSPMAKQIVVFDMALTEKKLDAALGLKNTIPSNVCSTVTGVG